MFGLVFARHDVFAEFYFTWRPVMMGLAFRMSDSPGTWTRLCGSATLPNLCGRLWFPVIFPRCILRLKWCAEMHLSSSQPYWCTVEQKLCAIRIKQSRIKFQPTDCCLCSINSSVTRWGLPDHFTVIQTCEAAVNKTESTVFVPS
jgi:hypothetical protein